jgi:hypothetical protein
MEQLETVLQVQVKAQLVLEQDLAQLVLEQDLAQLVQQVKLVKAQLEQALVLELAKVL